MKKIIVTSLAILLTGLFAQAQTDSTKVKQTNYLSKQLNINDALAIQVESIMADYKANVAKLMESKKLDQATMKTKIDVLIEEKNTKLKKILTQEQLNKLLPTSEKKKN